MPFKEVSVMDQREEFCRLGSRKDVNIRELCRRYEISPPTGYLWLSRYRDQGRPGLEDRSRRPHRSPTRTCAEQEAAVVELRKKHPAWGGRKLRAYLLARGICAPVPSASTITEILRRHELLNPAQAASHRPWERFEAAFPNDMWQMDFKGHFPLVVGRCHPLTVLDDHSRVALGLRALANERRGPVQEQLIALFRCYGLPNRILADNGPPWGDPFAQQFTRLGVWLLHLGIHLGHGRPWHPQTQGKDERFHRTLKTELLRDHTFGSLADAQDHFDRWRHVYNHERPHEALGLQPPISRYALSPRPYPEQLPPIEYDSGESVRRVQQNGHIYFRNQEFMVSKAFGRYPVAIRPTQEDAILHVYFRHFCIGQIVLRCPTA